MNGFNPLKAHRKMEHTYYVTYLQYIIFFSCSVFIVPIQNTKKNRVKFVQTILLTNIIFGLNDKAIMDQNQTNLMSTALFYGKKCYYW